MGGGLRAGGVAGALTPASSSLSGALSAADLADRLDLGALAGREVAAYSVSCKSQSNINLVLDWLTKHAK